MTTIGDRIKILRGNESQTSFGTRFGASRNTVMRYESGERTPDADFIAALCKHYGADPSWMLFGSGSPPFKGPAQRAAEEIYREEKPPKGLAQRIAEDGPDVVTKETAPRGDFHLSMGDSMELLVNIHKSGNNVLIRAINANLMAFNEAIENRDRAETTFKAIADMRDQIKEMGGKISVLEQENQDLRQKILSRDDREQESAAG